VSVCFYHGDRPGIGVCVRCRRVICSDCCTRLEGINHCHACLRKLAQRSEGAGRDLLSQGMSAGLLVGMGWLVLFALLWLTSGILAR
jgi:hypothetical protein